MTTPQPPSRSRSLDVLRAIAVLLVIGNHLGHMGPTASASPAVSFALSAWQRGGWIGVDLFFVLSGFLVSGLLFREYQRRGEVNVGRFLARRGLKIYPAFYAYLAVTVLLQVAGVAGLGDPLSRRGLAAEALFVQNYFPGVAWHTWSLAVEEHFYLLCAALVVLLVALARDRKDPFRAIPLVFVGVATAVLLLRIVNAGETFPYSHAAHLFPTHLRLDGLLFGVCLAYLAHFRPERLDQVLAGRERAWAVVGGVLLLPAFALPRETSPVIYTFGFTAFYVGSGMLVVVAVRRGMPDNALVRALALAGAYSYSIYLWHVTAMVGARRLLGAAGVGDWWWQVAAAIAAPVAVGVVMAKLVEMPVIRLRDRFFPSEAGSPGAVPPGETTARA